MSDCELGTSASLPRVVRGAETLSRLEKRTLRRRFLEPAPPRAPCRRDPLWGDHNTSPAVRIYATPSAQSGSHPEPVESATRRTPEEAVTAANSFPAQSWASV